MVIHILSADAGQVTGSDPEFIYGGGGAIAPCRPTSWISTCQGRTNGTLHT